MAPKSEIQLCMPLIGRSLKLLRNGKVPARASEAGVPRGDSLGPPMADEGCYMGIAYRRGRTSLSSDGARPLGKS